MLGSAVQHHQVMNHWVSITPSVFLRKPYDRTGLDNIPHPKGSHMIHWEWEITGTTLEYP